MMETRLFTPAEIFRAKALGCEPEQLLPADRTCSDCEAHGACQFLCEEPIGEYRHCRFPANQFRDAWRPRAA